MKWNVTLLTGVIITLLICAPANGQLTRKRAYVGGPVEDVFMTPAIVTMSSVTNLPKNNWNLTIMHAFGVATNGARDLFGLDAAANIRFGLDYGISDGISVGVGRSRFDKLFDFRIKGNILRQTTDDHIPVDVAMKWDAGIMTLENGFDISDRLNYLTALMIARKVSDRVSIQISPLFSHFNTVFKETDGVGGAIEERNNHVALGFGIQLAINPRTALVLEYIPVLGARSEGTRDEMAMALDIETGGHVFQLFFKTSQWLTEQHAMARNTDAFFDGDFRFGFNVNRFFAFVSE